MNDDTNTQGQQLEANPNGATATPAVNGGNPSEPQKTEVNQNEGKTYTQKQLDDANALARGTAERETKKKLLAELGLKADEEDKLLAFKQAYEASLSEEEKKSKELENLQADNIKLSQDLEEKDYIIKALIALTGKKEEDVDKIVKMAKGLKTEENTIEEAINEVISMVQPVIQPSIGKPVVIEQNPDMPIGQPIQQPSQVVVDTQDNPFKAGNINLTKQGKLIKENPELAKKLAAEAGVKLNI